MTTEISTDYLEQQLCDGEAIIARVRAHQAALLTEADRRQLPLGDGCRTLVEWTASRLDVAPETAKTLVRLARSRTERAEVFKRLQAGEWSVDRSVESDRWVQAGEPEDRVVSESTRFDIGGLRTRVALARRLAPSYEVAAFEGRYLVTQRTLDRSSGRLWGQLPGADMDQVEQNLIATADAFPPLPDGTTPTRPQRMADALVALTTGQPIPATAPNPARDRDPESASSSRTLDWSQLVPVSAGTLSVFIDGGAAHTAGGYAVGDSVIHQLLCDGHIEHTRILESGSAVEAGGYNTVTDRQRRRIHYRDKTCGADGCTTRYRLQVHHRHHRSHGGPNTDDNLVLLCWYHHHIVIHRHRFTIDPASPPGRLRFTPPGTDPPQRQ